MTVKCKVFFLFFGPPIFTFILQKIIYVVDPDLVCC